MNGFVNIVIADADDADAIGESFAPVEEWSGLELKGIDPAKLATLHSVITGEDFDTAMAQYFVVYAASDEGPWVIRVPEALLERLVELEEDALEEIGEELAGTEEFEMAAWPVEELQAVLIELSLLARSCLAQGFAMFVWMSPVDA